MNMCFYADTPKLIRNEIEGCLSTSGYPCHTYCITYYVNGSLDTFEEMDNYILQF